MEAIGRRLLVEVLETQREAIVERATDWVIEYAVDLGGKRPREETRALVERVVAGNEAALLEDEMGPIAEFVEFVTTYRAARGFQVSTLLKGLLSFRQAIEAPLRARAGESAAAFEVLAAIDQVAAVASFRVADIYFEKVSAAQRATERVTEERQMLEAEIARQAESARVVLEEKAAMIERQRRELATLSSPVLRVWKRVIVAPLVGEVSGERAAILMENVLGAIVAHGARRVLLDVTGLTRMDEEVAGYLVRLIGAARMLGAEGVLVGVSPEAATALGRVDVELGEVQAFGTLYDALRAALVRRR
jgi:rsbT co-antagonist protein RsbR